MKKITLISFLFLSLVFLLTACDGGHTHSYTLKNVDDVYLASPADCEKAAEYYYSCACGEKGDTTFANGAKLGHDEQPHDAKAPTCTEVGWDAYVTCSRCDYTTYAEKAALEHDEQTHDAKAPTCTEVGWDAYVTCSRCDYTTYAEKAALEHDEQSHDAKAPTCTEVGWDAYVTCSRCDYTTYVEKGVIDHVYSSTLKHNSTHHYCECSCGAKKDEAKHVSSGAATANKDEVCTVCGYVINKAVGISFNSLTVDGTNVYGKVSNDTIFYSFINEVNTFGGAKYIVSNKITGENPISTKTVELDVGDNTVYVIEMIDGEPTAIYTVVIRRRPIYEVTFNTNGGTAVGTQFVEEDSLATASSTTRVGYTFAGWSYDFSTPVTSDIRVTANWNPNTNTPYRVEYYLENLEDSGYTLTETENLLGTTDTTATAEQKVFEHFTFNSSKSVMRGNIAGDGSLVLKIYHTRDSYTIKTSVTDAKGGSVTVGGTYPYGTEIKLSATVNAGYSFFGYFAGDDKLCETTDYIFTVSENLDIVTKIEANEDTPYKVEYYLENLEDSGYTLTETENLFGTTDTTATAEQKVFEHFTFNSAKSAMSGNIAGDGSLVLKVYYTRDKYTIKTSVTDAKGGSVTVGGTYPYGTEIKLSATVNAGYSFLGYFVGDDKICDTTDYTFTVSESLDIVAKIEANKDTPYKVEYYLENLEDSGYTLTETENLFGTTDTIATAEQKVFEHFTFNSSKSVMSGNIAGNGSLVLKVYYTRNRYAVSNSNSELGNITNGGMYKYGTYVTLTAHAKLLGYEFVGWYSEDELISTETTYAFTADRDIEARFAVRADMANFIFTSSATSCKITGIKDNTVTEIIVPNCVTSIGKGAFSSCNNINRITLPFVGASKDGNSNTHFGYIFGASSHNDNFGCVPSSLKTVVITGGTSIGSHAFYCCDSLASIEIPDSVTSIGSCAFDYCDSLTSVNFGENSLLTSIGSYAFNDCDSLARIEIPDSVISIGDYAFYCCSSLTSVKIGNGVTSIGYGAFHNCSSITSIVIPDSVTSIGSYAFYNCSSLTSVKIGNGVTSIGDWAFHNCSSLTNVTIGNGVTSIGYGAFDYCDSLTSVNFGENSLLTSIGSYAFNDCDSLARIEIPDSVISIGSCAFEYCTSLASVTIGKGVTSIGERAFYNCYKLVEVINKSQLNITAGSFDNGHVAYYAKEVHNGESKIVNKDGYLFYSYKGINYLLGYVGDDTELTFSESYGGESYEIYDYAFYNCDSLTSVTIPDSVTSIGDSAFEDCRSLTSVTIGNSVTSIGDNAFIGCYELVEVINKSQLNITAGSSSNGYVSYYAKEVHRGESKIVNKDGYLFYTYNDVNYLLGYVGDDIELTLPDSYNGENYTIYRYAFDGNDKITSVTIPNSVTSIGYYAFSDCTSLVSIVIPDSVTSIGDSAFEDCRSLTSVTIGNSVTSIGFRAFSDCTSLTSVTIPDSVTSIDIHAFDSCTSLTSVTIGNGVTSISSTAFQSCTSLTSVTIGNSVTSIGDNAFYNCSSLTSIKYRGSQQQWNSISKGKNWNQYYSNGSPCTINYTMTYNYTGK